MAVLMITAIKNFIGLSTDTKPTTDIPPGSTFWAWDTGTLFTCYDGTSWIAYSVDSVTQPGTVDLHNGAGARDLFTATGGSVWVEYFTLTLPAVSVADDVDGITGISVQTDTTTVIILVAAANALVAPTRYHSPCPSERKSN
jgi:hypothetical protein